MADEQTVIPMKDWMQRSTLNYDKRTENALKVRRIVQLGQDTVVKVMAKTFEVVSRDAHYITIASRLILADRVSGKVFQEDEIFKAEQAINAQLERINEYFDARIRQARQKIESAGMDPNDVVAVTKRYETKSATQTATEYLSVLIKADMYLTLVQYLWILGELAKDRDEALRAKLNTEREVRNHLNTIAKTTTNHFNILRRICNGVLGDRKAESAKQSERDKKKHAERVASQQADMKALGAGTSPAEQLKAAA